MQRNGAPEFGHISLRYQQTAYTGYCYVTFLASPIEAVLLPAKLRLPNALISGMIIMLLSGF
jgi:hypothetical protein